MVGKFQKFDVSKQTLALDAINGRDYNVYCITIKHTHKAQQIDVILAALEKKTREEGKKAFAWNDATDSFHLKRQIN